MGGGCHEAVCQELLVHVCRFISEGNLPGGSLYRDSGLPANLRFEATRS